jgi:hypothetical protein
MKIIVVNSNIVVCSLSNCGYYFLETASGSRIQECGILHGPPLLRLRLLQMDYGIPIPLFSKRQKSKSIPVIGHEGP